MKFNIKAFVYHLLASVTVIGFISLFILTVWFPRPWSSELGGYDLFIKIVLIDVFIGPLCVALTYKSHKKRLEKVTDVAIISLCQLAFIGYGLWVLSESRPAYIVFNHDRLDVMVVNEIEPKDFGDKKPFDRFSLFGPVFATVDKKLIEAMQQQQPDFLVDFVTTGQDFSNFPKYFTNYADNKAEILAVAQGYDAITDAHFQRQADLMLTKHQLTKDQFTWLPVRHRFGFIVAVLDKETAQPLDYIIIDSYEAQEPK